MFYNINFPRHLPSCSFSSILIILNRPEGIQNARWVVLDRVHQNVSNMESNNPFHRAPSMLFMITFVVIIWLFVTRRWKWKWMKSGQSKKIDLYETDLVENNFNLHHAAKYRALAPTTLESSKVRFLAR
jgi:hypothetical protein